HSCLPLDVIEENSNIIPNPSFNFHVFGAGPLVTPALQRGGRSAEDFGRAFGCNEFWKFIVWKRTHGDTPGWYGGPGVSWPAIRCDSCFIEIANVNHFESLRARMSNEFSERAYSGRL